jgi:hypothetical protein
MATRLGIERLMAGKLRIVIPDGNQKRTVDDPLIDTKGHEQRGVFHLVSRCFVDRRLWRGDLLTSLLSVVSPCEFCQVL